MVQKVAFVGYDEPTYRAKLILANHLGTAVDDIEFFPASVSPRDPASFLNLQTAHGLSFADTAIYLTKEVAEENFKMYTNLSSAVLGDRGTTMHASQHFVDFSNLSQPEIAHWLETGEAPFKSQQKQYTESDSSWLEADDDDEPAQPQNREPDQDSLQEPPAPVPDSRPVAQELPSTAWRPNPERQRERPGFNEEKTETEPTPVQSRPRPVQEPVTPRQESEPEQRPQFHSLPPLSGMSSSNGNQDEQPVTRRELRERGTRPSPIVNGTPEEIAAYDRPDRESEQPKPTNPEPKLGNVSYFKSQTERDNELRKLPSGGFDFTDMSEPTASPTDNRSALPPLRGSHPSQNGLQPRPSAPRVPADSPIEAILSPEDRLKQQFERESASRYGSFIRHTANSKQAVVTYVTGSGGGVGKTTISWVVANTAALAAKQLGMNKSVWLIEADYRHPKLQNRISAPKTIGNVAQILERNAERGNSSPTEAELSQMINDAVVVREDTGLKVLTLPYDIVYDGYHPQVLKYAIMAAINVAMSEGGYVFIDSEEFSPSMFEDLATNIIRRHTHHIFAVSTPGSVQDDLKRLTAYFSGSDINFELNNIHVIMNYAQAEDAEFIQQEITPLHLDGMFPYIPEIARENFGRKKNSSSWVGSAPDDVLGALVLRAADLLHSAGYSEFNGAFASESKQSGRRGRWNRRILNR